jgi:hypothetical protein
VKEPRFQIGKVGGGTECVFELGRIDRDDRLRLGVVHRGIWVVANLGQPPLSVTSEGIDDRRVIGTPASIREHLRGGQPTRLARPHLGIASDGHDPDCDGHVLARQPGGLALPVPTFVGMAECVLYGVRQPEARGEPRRDLAMARQTAVPGLRIRQRPHNTTDAAVRREVLREMPQEETAALPSAGVQHRRHRPVEGDVVATGQGRRVGRIGSTPEESEQRDVID